ncbi:MAG: ABC transporter permease [Pyrinomonadaceae bacterium]
MLLVGAGLFIKSFYRLRTTDAGFDAANVLTLQLSLPRVRYADQDQQTNFFQQTLDRITVLPGVQAVGTITNLPLGNSRQSSSFSVDDRPTSSPNEQRNATINSISPDYFRAMSIPLRQGRAFTARDTAKAPGVVIVNEALARRFFAGENPLGKRLTIGEPEEIKTYGEPVSREIVGVVKDVRFELEMEAAPEMYVPYTQRPQSLAAIVMRASVAPIGCDRRRAPRGTRSRPGSSRLQHQDDGTETR